MCFSCICLFVLYVLILLFSLSLSWFRVLAAVCDCGSPWTFPLTFLEMRLTTTRFFCVYFSRYEKQHMHFLPHSLSQLKSKLSSFRLAQ